MITFYPEQIYHPEDYYYKFLKLYDSKYEENGLKANFLHEMYKGQMRLFRLSNQNIVIFSQCFFYEEVQYHISYTMENTWGQLRVVFIEDVGYTFTFDIVKSNLLKADYNTGFSLHKYSKDGFVCALSPNTQVEFLSIYLSSDYLKDVWGWAEDSPSFNYQERFKDNTQPYIAISNTQCVETLNKIFDQSMLHVTDSPIKEHLETAIHDILEAYIFCQKSLNNDLIKNLKYAEELLLKDFKNPPTLNNLSKIAGVNRDKFQKSFVAFYGCTFYQYYQKKRFNYAKKLIQQLNYTASEAAYAIGYKHLGHFSREFAKINGIKPSEIKSNND